MNKANESFSAFLDGEASELDVQRMLKALDDSPAVLAEWHGLSKVQASLQQDVIVNTALEYTGVDDVPEKRETKGISFRLFQGGIAAAVAIVVVTTANFMTTNEASPAVAEITVEPIQDSPSLAQQHFEVQQRLELFMREHAEQASFTTGHVVVPSELEWVEGDQ
jgi:sigma-E factor negative regulatory protein RseA